MKEQGLETRKLRQFLAKEEEEEDVQRDSKIVKEYVKSYIKCLKCKSRSCFYRLFMSGQENHWKSYNLEKILRETIGKVTSFDFYSKLVTSNRLPKPCNRLHKAFYEKI